VLLPIPISALEHFSYCARQCALIHLEQIFEDNVFTERGHIAHRRVDRPGLTDGSVRFAMTLWSDRLGLIGRADAVEFHGDDVVPVEHKVGERREWMHERYQLCAQALCLEEMLGCQVHEGAIFYRASQRRSRVVIDAELRRATEALIVEVRNALAVQTLPAPVADSRCTHCSLKMVCLPEPLSGRRRVAQLRAQVFRA
jgi:CRISPR-associated exonuclease Cas4